MKRYHHTSHPYGLLSCANRVYEMPDSDAKTRIIIYGLIIQMSIVRAIKNPKITNNLPFRYMRY